MRFDKRGNHALRVLREQAARADSGKGADDGAVMRAACSHRTLSEQNREETLGFLYGRGVPAPLIELLSSAEGEDLDESMMWVCMAAVNGVYAEGDACELTESRKVDRWSAKLRRMVPSNLWTPKPRRKG